MENKLHDKKPIKALRREEDRASCFVTMPTTVKFKFILMADLQGKRRSQLFEEMVNRAWDERKDDSFYLGDGRLSKQMGKRLDRIVERATKILSVNQVEGVLDDA